MSGGQMTNVTAINAVPVFEEVCAGHSFVTEQMRDGAPRHRSVTTRSGACGLI